MNNLGKIKSFIQVFISEFFKSSFRSKIWKILEDKVKDKQLDIFFPKICLNCQKEGEYLCQDCFAVLDVLKIHQKEPAKNLTDLYFALSYQNFLAKKLIWKFKYQPFIKELSKTLADLIIAHFQLLGNVENLPARNAATTADKSGFILVPVPLGKRRLRWRGFNQAEEIGKQLSFYFKIPLIANILIKIKETRPQIELDVKKRKENVLEVFHCQNPALIKNKKIVLVDDVYTTGSTMAECAGVLKRAGAKKIIGIAVARAKPEEDYPLNI